MKAFRFRLDRILGLRRRAERDARRELGWATSRLTEARNFLASAERSRDGLEEESGVLVTAGNVAALPLQQALLEYAKGACRKATELVTEREAEVERHTEIWHEKRRDLRSLELLKERAHQEWRDEWLREEGREMDEIGRVRFLRQRGDES